LIRNDVLRANRTGGPPECVGFGTCGYEPVTATAFITCSDTHNQ